MRIAVVCSPLIKCPPDNYGGIERIVSWVGNELVRRGHDVWLFGRTGSHLIEGGKGVYEYEGGENFGYAELIAEAHLKHSFDIIHDITHDKLLMQIYPQLAPRTVNTLQGLANRGPNTTCISFAQRRDLGYSEAVPVVHQGVHLEEYAPIQDPSLDYFLYMGSINDYKGVDIAIDVCERTNNKLIIAGVAWDQDYFKRHVEPRCDGVRIIWAGEAGGDTKLGLLQNARALLHPVRWTEPGAIIVGEAFACGVPVIGSNNGVLPELIIPAVGKICQVQHFDSYPKMAGGCYNVQEWEVAVNDIDDINRNDCVDYARGYLTDVRMTDQYLEVYDRIRSGDNWI